MLRTLLLMGVALIALTPHAAAQDAKPLRTMLSDLFTFGDCGQPLCLDGSINAANGHGDHYLPAAATGNEAVISFITDAIGTSVSRTPVSATSSGVSFTFVGGIPVRSTTSAGPIFAERARTLGKGRLFIGANVTGVNFSTLSGTRLDQLRLNFVHQDVDPVGSLGDPVRENDIIRVNMNLDINLLVSSLFMTFGVTDFIDVGIAVPFVRTSVRGESEAQIEPFGTTAIHFFGGDTLNPVLNAAAAIDGSAAGLGDIAARVKVNVGQSDRFGAALLADARFATGKEEELLGSGATSIRALGIMATTFGSFSAHLNAGYLVRTGETQNDAILATVGFDQLMAPWATLAFDVISEWQVGDDQVALPETVSIDTPFPRRIEPLTVLASRENLIEASLGAKFAVRGGTVLVTNVIVPITRVGLQSDLVWTTGVEFAF